MPDDVQALGRRRSARPSPSAARTRCHGEVTRAGNAYGMSWLPGTASTGGPSCRRRAGCLLVLVTPAAVRQVAAGDDELGRDPLDQVGQRALEDVVVAGPEMEVRDVEDACLHRRSRLYSD